MKIFRPISITKFGGELFFILYLFLAVYFYLERTLFLDNAFQIFLLIQDQKIEVNADRWPAVINRILPFALSKIHISLKYILLAFSINYVLVQYVIYYFIRHVNRDIGISILYIFILSVPVCHGFFWCNSELVLGICISLLWISTYNKGNKLIAMALGICLAWIHPLTIFFTSFYILLEFSKVLRNYKHSVISILPFYLSYSIKKFFYPNWYDAEKSRNFVSNLSSYNWSEDWGGLQLLFQFDYIYLIGLSVAFIYLLIKQQFRISALLGFTTLVYLFILDVSNGPQNPSNEFYEEINMYFLFFMIGLSLIQVIHSKISKFYPYVLATCCMVSCLRWINTSTFYASRIDWYKEILLDYDRKIINVNDVNNSPIVMEWASAFESLIISSLEHKSQTVLITSVPERYVDLTDGHLFLTEFKNYNLEDLNSEYFNLEPIPYEVKYLD